MAGYSSSDLSDEDNHPDHRHWYERKPEAARKRRNRGRRPRPGEYIPPMWATGPFVHHPVHDPDDPEASRPLTDAEADQLLAEYQAQERSDAAARKARKTARKARAAAKKARAAAKREMEAARRQAKATAKAARKAIFESAVLVPWAPAAADE